MNNSNQFEDLVCWQEARKFKLLIYELVKKFPQHEIYSLQDQIKRSASSVTANIAEGVGRYLPKATIQFLRNSRGSLYETLDHVYTAYDLKYITYDDLINIKESQHQVCRILSGYIKFQQSRIKTFEEK